ncbi:hypothetical protein AAGF08_03065 [Algoriphagus sp. SE2]|uniref:hypothetical protein n=1 Tax=Algoriphagus sp. SE2 TaxID=3141536 RepID=UPI0031CD1FF7
MNPIIRVISLLFLLFGWSQMAFAQHGNMEVIEDDPDKTLFGKVLKEGKFEFHLRSYFMATQNQGYLLDYQTWGTGAGIGYFSPRWKGLGLGFSGFFVFRHFENNVTAIDPLTQSPNRYEILLYDLQNPTNHKDLDRLEEFFLSYEKESLSIWVGRHHFDSPFLNASDNRMRPNLFSGISVEVKPGKLGVKASWFSHVISRGSLEWLSVEESFGLYNTGRNPLDSEESYKHHIDSKGIASLGFDYVSDRAKFESWSYLAEGVFGLSTLQATGHLDMNLGPEFLWGIQGFYESAVGDGGNENPQKAYILPNEQTSGLGLRGGLKWPKSKLTLNYLKISDKGRFLFPREWGREQFFVSLPRERFEGLGGVSVRMIKYDQSLVDEKLKIGVGFSHVDNPDHNDFHLNKYGIPDYFQVSGLVDYRFKGFFQGLDLQLQVVGKKEAPSQELPPESIINKVNMINYSLIVDYRF